MPSISEHLHLLFLLPRMFFSQRVSHTTSFLSSLRSLLKSYSSVRPSLAIYLNFQASKTDSSSLPFSALFSSLTCIYYSLFFLNEYRDLVWFVYCAAFLGQCLAHSRYMIKTCWDGPDTVFLPWLTHGISCFFFSWKYLPSLYKSPNPFCKFPKMRIL